MWTRKRNLYCRFWWRDTRLAELSQTLPPNINFPVNPTSSNQSNLISNSPRYCFPYPTKFIPIPYYTNTSLHLLDTRVIPFARELRVITVDVPIYTTEQPNTEPVSHWNLIPQNSTTTFHPHLIEPMAASIQPDGLLLYVSEASYESGTSPLSSWIPITGYDKDLGKEKDPEEEDEGRGDVSMDGEKRPSRKGGPLDLFQRFVFLSLSRCFWMTFWMFLLIRLVKRRLEGVTFPMHPGSLSGADVDMDN